jgi:hypothetical protein
MVTGDHEAEAGLSKQAETELREESGVRCSCEWITMDTGNQFYSRIVERDPNCAAHRR